MIGDNFIYVCPSTNDTGKECLLIVEADGEMFTNMYWGLDNNSINDFVKTAHVGDYINLLSGSIMFKIVPKCN